MTRPRSLRTWLVLAVGVLVALPAAAGAGAWIGMSAWQKADDRDRAQRAAKVVADGQGRWDDPAWRRQAVKRLGELGTRAEVVSKQLEPIVLAEGLKKQPGQPAGAPFATPGLAPDARKEQRNEDMVATTFPLPVQPGEVVASAVIVERRRPGAAPRLVAGLGGGLVALVAALAVGSLALRRFVAGPLAALADGAERIAGGDLEVAVLRSPVREIDQVAGAMSGMSASLRTSVARDASADAERRFLISAVAHDLRTPLFTLRGYLEGLDRGLDDGTYVARARDKATLLDRLVSDLFAFSRAEWLKERPRRECVELGELARRATATVAETARVKDVEIAVEGAPVALKADPHAIARVLANLLDNAVRHAPPGSCVDVRWREESGQAILEVADRGDGLASDELERVFEPLYRGDGARNSRTGGAGLGLAIARRLAEAHGGTVAAANRLGGGACFVVTLPVAASRSATAN